MRRNLWRNFDFLLFGAVVFMCLFGIVMIQSAIAGSEELADYPQRQAIFVAAGLVMVIIMAAIDYHLWASIAKFIYAFAFAALFIIYVYGEARFGSARWIDTGVILIQPSEIVKILMIMVLADHFTRTWDDKKDFKWIIRSFILTFGIVVWILLQPNLSTSIVIFVIWFALLWISGLPAKYLAILAVAGILLVVIAFPFLEDYQQARILNFIFPDPEASYGDVYNIQQSKIAIGSGGWFGEGYGQGTQVQLRFLKVRHTDFIFSVVAEEFGFVGTTAIIALMAFIIVRCIRVAQTASDHYGSLLAFGYAAMLFFQTAINIGVNLNLVPVSGLPFPFLSYGGSSLVSSIVGIGLVESVALRKKIIQ
ncbi:MAG: rod shape-determining protein RodA [Chloroflexi bacterium]|jgi:rod shape determining protein RodA|nr:rod shape-determining protein RodA [Chloroflexota bacterium]